MKNKKTGNITSIISVALLLTMVGLYLILALHARHLVQVFKEKVDIWVELKEDTPQAEISRLMGELKRNPSVKPETITFITREEAAAQLTQDLGNENLLEDIPSMMRDILRFNVSADYLQTDSLAAFRGRLKEDPHIADLFFDTGLTQNVSENIEKIGWITFVLGILLIFAAFALIHNTVRLALYSNRFLIKNQELVGATWSFIARPYWLSGVKNGFFSGIIAVLSLLIFLYLIGNKIPELREIEYQFGTWMVFFFIVLFGLFIGGISSYYTVRKFLGKKLEDLY